MQNIWFEISPVFTIGHMNPQNITGNKIGRPDTTICKSEYLMKQVPYLKQIIQFGGVEPYYPRT